jgi:hypothetical protein
MFSYIQTKFMPPLPIERLSTAEGLRVIQDRFKAGHQIVEIFGQNPMEISANASAWANAQPDPTVWLRLEKEDADPGRFWTLLVMGLRKYQPEIGLTVLNTILDHHTYPPEPAREKFTGELSEIPLILVLDGIEQICETDWWPDFVSWLEKSALNRVLLLNYSNDVELTQYAVNLQSFRINDPDNMPEAAKEWLASLSPDIRTTLAALDSWWLPWLNSQFDSRLTEHEIDAMQAEGLIESVYPGNWLPGDVLIKMLNRRQETDTGIKPKNLERNLAKWLAEQGEWLESIRYTLKAGDFEEAAEIFEQKSDGLLKNKQNAADVLFWLKELPGILLTSRPVLCWLAAACAAEIGLQLQVKIFLNDAENNLMSLMRFSRSPEQWRNMAINENGVTVADLLERIERLRSE